MTSRSKMAYALFGAAVASIAEMFFAPLGVRGHLAAGLILFGLAVYYYEEV